MWVHEIMKTVNLIIASFENFFHLTRQDLIEKERQRPDSLFTTWLSVSLKKLNHKKTTAPAATSKTFHLVEGEKGGKEIRTFNAISSLESETVFEHRTTL